MNDIICTEICLAADKYYGIKTDIEDAEKLLLYLREKYGEINPGLIENAFITGEASPILTVSETYFFREEIHFAFLQEQISLIKKSAENKSIRILSAAVASGCEAYSIAMLLEGENSYYIDAFDVNPESIDTAQKGIYGPRALREDGSSYHKTAFKYMEKNGSYYHVNREFNINFYIHNFMNEFPGNNYDIIFFRNAFIYLTVSGRERILHNLSSALRPGGILIMGLSETAGAKPPQMESMNLNDVFYFKKLYN